MGRAFAIVLAALVCLGAGGAAAMSDVVSLTLPRALRDGETVWIEIEVGEIGRGQEIDVRTSSGQDLGTISPFGARGDGGAGTFALPVPQGAFRDRRLDLRLTTTDLDGRPRPVTEQAVHRIELRIAAPNL